MNPKNKLATEHTEKTASLPVTSVFSDETTSHSTKLPKDGSQVAGYVAKRGLLDE
jgi:hypothetical protein